MQAPKTPDSDDLQKEWDEEEQSDRDLKEFAFFSRLEENGGKPTKGLYLSGCFFILPMLAFLSIALYFLMDRLY